MNYHYKNDFIIDLDNLWKWLDFSSKHKSKELLTKYFKINTDYKILLTPTGEQKNIRGGHNKEIIMLNIITFKKLITLENLQI